MEKNIIGLLATAWVASISAKACLTDEIKNIHCVNLKQGTDLQFLNPTCFVDPDGYKVDVVGTVDGIPFRAKPIYHWLIAYKIRDGIFFRLKADYADDYSHVFHQGRPRDFSIGIKTKDMSHGSLKVAYTVGKGKNKKAIITDAVCTIERF